MRKCSENGVLPPLRNLRKISVFKSLSLSTDFVKAEGLHRSIKSIASAFTSHPIPGVQATHQDAYDQKHQCPRIGAGPSFIDPDSRCDANKGRDCHGPPDKPEHTQAKPNASVRLLPRSYFAVFFGADLFDETVLRFLCIFDRTVISHIAESPGNAEQSLLQFSPWPYERFSHVRPGPQISPIQ